MITVGKIAATVGGVAWTVKAGAIIAMDGHFQPIEGVLYFIGVGGIFVGAFGLAAFAAARFSGAVRWIVFVVALAVALFVTAVASSFIQEMVADSYTGTNVGIEEEIGILTPGVIWLIIGLFLLMASRSRTRAGSEKASPSSARWAQP